VKASELVTALKPLEGHKVKLPSMLWIGVVTVEELAPEYRDRPGDNVLLADGTLRDNGDRTTTPMGIAFPAAPIERIEQRGHYLDMHMKNGRIMSLLIGESL